MHTIDLTVYKKVLIRGMQLLVVAILLYLIYFFYHPEADFFLLTIRNPFYEYVKSLEWWLYLVIYLTIISFIHIIALGILSFFFTIRRSTIEKLSAHYEILFTEYLVNYFFTPNMTNEVKSELMLRIKKHTKRKVPVLWVFTIYTRLQDITTTDLSREFTILLDTIKLRKKLKSLLSSYNFSNKILAFKVISYLKIPIYNQIILKYTRSNNYALRSEAIAALIRLSMTNNLSFLIDHTPHLSILDVNVIVNAVLDNSKLEVDYHALMRSNMPNKILIAILIAKHRKKTELKDDIKSLIGYPDETLNAVLWDCYLEMENDRKKYTDLIIHNFNMLSEKVKILILSKQININDQRYYDFLTRVIKEDKSLIVIKNAMNQLFNYNLDLISQLTDSDDKYISMAYKDVIDIYS